MESNWIGKKIIEERKKLNFSQLQLAKKLFISSQAIGKWERGESLPDFHMIIKLAKIFNVDLNFFSAEFSKNYSKTSETNTSLNQKWDLSNGNFKNGDFTNIKNLSTKLTGSNIINCIFKKGVFSTILFKSNNIEKCDFTDAKFDKSQIELTNFNNIDFKNCTFFEAILTKNNFTACDFSNLDFSGAIVQKSNMTNCKLENIKFIDCSFKGVSFYDIIFESSFDNCSFENCSFNLVTFQNLSFKNVFFKNNKNIKKVKFINCLSDSISYSFLKNESADLSKIKSIAK